MSTIKAEKLQSLGSKLNFLTGATPTQRLTIDENGKVGIGTATPQLTLQVVGSIAAVGGAVDYPVTVNSNAIFVGGAGTPDSGRIIIGDNSGWKYKISNRINSITTDLVTFDDRGMVGIGFTSPDSPLHVLGAQNYGSAANSGIVTIGNANNSRQINLGVSDTNSAVYIEGWVPGNGGSNLVLQPSGSKVGIGVAAPAVALDIAGEARSSTSTTATSNDQTLTTKDYVDVSQNCVIGIVPTCTTQSQGYKSSKASNTNIFTFTRIPPAAQPTTAAYSGTITAAYGTWFIMINGSASTDVSFDNIAYSIYGVVTTTATTFKPVAGGATTATTNSAWLNDTLHGGPSFMAIRTA